MAGSLYGIEQPHFTGNDNLKYADSFFFFVLKAAEAEKLHKIHIREENCRKVTQKMDKIVNRLPVESSESAKPFDENEVVPALRHKTGESKLGEKKTQKVGSATKKSGSKSDNKNVKKSSKMA